MIGCMAVDTLRGRQDKLALTATSIDMQEH